VPRDVVLKTGYVVRTTIARAADGRYVLQ